MLFSNFVKSEEENSLNISGDIKQLKKDLKTLEKAVYKTSQVSNSSTSTSNSLNEDILTRHLLKLNDIETQFQELTNKFEEVNFKMDKLSKRITKMQSDNQMRFSDIENNPENLNVNKKSTKNKKMPGTDLPENLGRISDDDLKETKEVLAFVFSMTNAIKVSLADGDFDFWDAKNFVEPLKKIAPAVENIEEVLPELEDLSLDEVIELTKYSMTELGLGGNIDVEAEVNDAVKKVEDAIDMGKKMLSLVKSIG